MCKQLLLGLKQGRGYRCNDCQYPKCALCDNRPEKAVSPNHLEADGSWYCRKHRYPPCSICRVAERPIGYQKSKLKFKEWICSGCETTDKKHPQRAGEEEFQPNSGETTGPSHKVSDKNSQASMVCQLPFCGKSPPEVSFKDRKAQGCNSCEYPVCANCGSQRPMDAKPLYAGLQRRKQQEPLKWYHHLSFPSE